MAANRRWAERTVDAPVLGMMVMSLKTVSFCQLERSGPFKSMLHILLPVSALTAVTVPSIVTTRAVGDFGRFRFMWRMSLDPPLSFRVIRLWCPSPPPAALGDAEGASTRTWEQTGRRHSAAQQLLGPLGSPSLSRIVPCPPWVSLPKEGHSAPCGEDDPRLSNVTLGVGAAAGNSPAPRRPRASTWPLSQSSLHFACEASKWEQRRLEEQGAGLSMPHRWTAANRAKPRRVWQDSRAKRRCSSPNKTPVHTVVKPIV